MVNGDGSGFTGLQDQQDGRTGRKIGFESANTSELKDWQEGKMGARGLAQRARERGRREVLLWAFFTHRFWRNQSV
jgi:hypothetical protein